MNDDPLHPADSGAQAAEGQLEAASHGFGTQGLHAARTRLIADFERRYLIWLLNHAGGNVSRAARIAGVDRTTLYRLMEKHGLQRRPSTVASD